MMHELFALCTRLILVSFKVSSYLFIVFFCRVTSQTIQTKPKPDPDNSTKKK